MRKIPIGAVAAFAAVVVGCHTITEEIPTEPSTTEAPATTGLLTVPIPALSAGTTSAPAPTATPAPTPGTPAPTPPPAPPPEPPGGGVEVEGCSEPLPPEISRVKTKIHIKGPNRYTLDSTPLVSGKEYCAKIGYTDGRTRCPVRPEGHPERIACEAYAVGRAEDTGRTGPTWTRNSAYCTGPPSGCENHPDNQYLLFAYSSGFYEACVQSGACGSVQVDR